MRVLIAVDGSPYADTALDLARALAWPGGTAMRLIEVLAASPLLAGPGVFGPDAVDASLVERCASLRREGITVEPFVTRGERAADAIVGEAERFGADLIVTGHHGHGGLATVFLGSVARDVAERAHCSVLVARTPTFDRVVVADDGSDAALEARRIVATWPIFTDKDIAVVSVAQVIRPLLAGVAVAVRDDARIAQAEAEMEARIAYGRLATAGADDLRLAGRRAAGHVLAGDPAEAIVSFANDRDAGLIVLGTRGRGAVARVLLGSVARAVLLGARCSVLVARRAER